MMNEMKKAAITLVAAACTITAGAQQALDNGIKEYRYHNYETAEKLFSPLTTGNPLANYYLGLSYLYGGDAATASATFQKFPDDPANMSGMARVAFVKNDVARGMQIAKDVAAKAKKKEWLPLEYAADAITYTSGGDYQQAIAWYKDALTRGTDDANIHIGLGDAYRRQSGGGGEAMNNYEHVTDKDAKNSLALSRIGDLWYDAQNYKSALDNYQRAKDADSTNPLPYKSLADAYSRSGRYDLALKSIKRYIQLSDNTKADQLEQVRLEYQSQSYCDAVTDAKAFISKYNPSDTLKTELYGIQGFSEAYCGDSVEAQTYMKYYFQNQKPSKISHNAYVEYGKLWLKLNQLDSASYYYTLGVKDDTSANKTDVYRQIAEAFRTKKEYEKSAYWYSELVKANPNTQAADYFWRGYMYYVVHNYSVALQDFAEYDTKYAAQQVSATYWHARGAAAVDSEATEGTAAPFFKQWLDKVGPDYDKKAELKIAYEYLLAVAYNKKQKEDLAQYKEKLRKIDPADAYLKQIEDDEKAPAPKKPHK